MAPHINLAMYDLLSRLVSASVALFNEWHPIQEVSHEGDVYHIHIMLCQPREGESLKELEGRLQGILVDLQENWTNPQQFMPEAKAIYDRFVQAASKQGYARDGRPEFLKGEYEGELKFKLECAGGVRRQAKQDNLTFPPPRCHIKLLGRPQKDSIAITMVFLITEQLHAHLGKCKLHAHLGKCKLDGEIPLKYLTRFFRVKKAKEKTRGLTKTAAAQASQSEDNMFCKERGMKRLDAEPQQRECDQEEWERSSQLKLQEFGVDPNMLGENPFIIPPQQPQPQPQPPQPQPPQPQPQPPQPQPHSDTNLPLVGGSVNSVSPLTVGQPDFDASFLANEDVELCFPDLAIYATLNQEGTSDTSDIVTKLLNALDSPPVDMEDIASTSSAMLFAGSPCSMASSSSSSSSLQSSSPSSSSSGLPSASSSGIALPVDARATAISVEISEIDFCDIIATIAEGLASPRVAPESPDDRRSRSLEPVRPLVPSGGGPSPPPPGAGSASAFGAASAFTSGPAPTSSSGSVAGTGSGSGSDGATDSGSMDVDDRGSDDQGGSMDVDEGGSVDDDNVADSTKTPDGRPQAMGASQSLHARFQPMGAAMGTSSSRSPHMNFADKHKHDQVTRVSHSESVPLLGDLMAQRGCSDLVRRENSAPAGSQQSLDHSQQTVYLCGRHVVGDLSASEMMHNLTHLANNSATEEKKLSTLVTANAYLARLQVLADLPDFARLLYRLLVIINAGRLTFTNSAPVMVRNGTLSLIADNGVFITIAPHSDSTLQFFISRLSKEVLTTLKNAQK